MPVRVGERDKLPVRVGERDKFAARTIFFLLLLTFSVLQFIAFC